jgi:MFS family permease
VIAFSLLGGVGNGLEGILLTTLVQERTPDRLQISVNGALESLHTAAPGLGFLLGGVLAAATTPRAAYVAAGLGTLAVLIVAAVAFSRPHPLRFRRSVALWVDLTCLVALNLHRGLHPAPSHR